MTNKEYTLKSLAYLVDGYIELRNNISDRNSEIPAKFIKGLSSLQLIGIKEQEYFPSNLDKFYELITIPIGKWGYDFINNAIDGLNINEYALYQEDLIDEYDEDSFYFDNEEFDEEDVDVLAGAKKIKKAILSNSDASDIDEFFNDRVFYELFKNLDQDNYQICRDGINNNLIRTRDFEGPNYFKGLSKEVIDLLRKDIYTRVDKYTQVHIDGNTKKPVIIKCSECGALMERDGKHHLKCPIPKCNTKKKMLGYSLHSYNNSDIIPYNQNILVLKHYYHKSIKFPGIAETELLNALNKFNNKYGLISKIVKYPKKDSADFLVYLTNGDIHIIDVKDYTDSKGLAEYLNSSESNDITNKKKHGLEYTKAFIIAPDYWSKKYRYRENFEETINNKKLNFHFIESYIKELESLTRNQQLTLI